MREEFVRDVQADKECELSNRRRISFGKIIILSKRRDNEGIQREEREERERDAVAMLRHRQAKYLRTQIKAEFVHKEPSRREPRFRRNVTSWSDVQRPMHLHKCRGQRRARARERERQRERGGGHGTAFILRSEVSTVVQTL